MGKNQFFFIIKFQPLNSLAFLTTPRYIFMFTIQAKLNSDSTSFTYYQIHINTCIMKMYHNFIQPNVHTQFFRLNFILKPPNFINFCRLKKPELIPAVFLSYSFE